MPDPGPLVRSEPPAAEWFDERVQGLITGLLQVFETLRQQMDMRPQAVEVVIAEDVAAAVRSMHGEVIGVEELEGFSLDRVGGVVAGKTMFRDSAHEMAVVVLDATLFRSDAEVARVGEIKAAAHELAHALVGQLRAAGGEPMAPTFLPWEASRWLAQYAIEEHIADTIAEVVLGLSGSVKLEDGSERPLTATDFGECAEAFLAAVDETFSDVVSTIHHYRHGRVDLEGMWLTVQSSTSEMLISLAHAQAERGQRSGERRECVAGGLAAPLERVWSTLCECLEIPLFDGPEEFVRREQQAIDTGGEAIIDFWRDLGLTYRPEGDHFYISVASPNNAWPAGPFA